MLIPQSLLLWLFLIAGGGIVLFFIVRRFVPGSSRLLLRFFLVAMLGLMVFVIACVACPRSDISLLTPSGLTGYRLLLSSYTYHFSNGTTAVLEPPSSPPPPTVIVNDRNEPCELHTVKYGGAVTAVDAEIIPAYSTKEVSYTIDYWGGDGPPEKIYSSGYTETRHWLKY